MTATASQIVFGPMPGYGPDAADSQRAAFVSLLETATYNGSCKWRKPVRNTYLARASYSNMTITLSGSPLRMNITERRVSAPVVVGSCKVGERMGDYELTVDETQRLLKAIYTHQEG